MPTKTVVRVLTVAAIAALSLLAAAGPASARTVPVYTYTGQYYDGTGSTAGTLAVPTDLDMNQTAEKGYVTDPARLGGSVSQFDGEGNPLAFSALEGATAISLHAESAQRVAVDNSTTSSEGNIYALTEKVVKGYRPDGTELGGGFPLGGFQRVCDIATDAEGDLWVVDYPRYKFTEYDSNGVPTGKTIPFKPFTTGNYNGACSLTIDSQDNFYFDAAGYLDGIPDDYGKKYDSEGHVLSDFAGSAASTTNATADMSTDHVFTIESKPFEGSFAPVVIEYDENGEAITSFGTPDPAHSFAGLEGPSGVAVTAGDEKVYVADNREYEGAKHIEIFEKTGQATVPTVRTEAPGLTPTKVTLRGTVDLDGAGDATECYFQWGSYGNYGEVAPCTPGSPISGAGVHEVTAQLEGLTQGTQYHYRLVATNANGILAFGRDRPFRPQGELSMSDTVVSEVNSDGARISADVNPNGGETRYFVEYGQEDCDLSSCSVAPLEETFLPKVLGTQEASVVLSGLKSDTSYHYRLVAKNDFGEVAGAEDVFRTYVVESTVDTCPNALIRKETGTVLLPDCRAYELVSAANTGGYDVRSDLIPGQAPLAAKPRAADSVLYSLNFGKIPGVGGEPTNHGIDPYIARRTNDGWTTTYAGIAVGDPPYQGPFASTPIEESEDLSTLLFGGPEICSPCFPDGKTGLPIRRNEGPLTQGMAGSLDPGPSAEPDGYIGRRLSADGTHLIFGSTAAFEQGAASSGDVSIYDRDLVAGVTHVVSKTPGGTSLPCLQGAGNCHGPGDADGIASLDVSGDGSRIIVAQRVSTDSAGNRYWHPYMNIDDSPSTVDLAPGTTSGVLYDGMSSDGSSVLYTTVDPLTADDHDNSADIYRADVSAGGARHAHACLERDRRRRHGFVRPGARRRPQQLERRRSLLDEQLRSCRVRRRGGSGGRDRSDLFPLSREARRNLGRSEPAEPLPVGARGTGSLRRHPRALQSRHHACGPGQRDARLRRLPGHAERRFRGLLVQRSPDRLPDRRTHGDLSLCGAGEFTDLRLLPDHPGDAERRHRTVRIRPEPRRRRQGLLHLDRSSGAARHRGVVRCLRAEGRTALPDLDRPVADGHGPSLGQRRRAQRLLLHTRDIGER